MKVIARGYATPDAEDKVVLSQLTITPQAAEDHAGLRRDLWWEFEYVPSRWDLLVARIPSTPTARSRAVGAVVVGFALIVVLAVAGAIQGAS